MMAWVVLVALPCVHPSKAEQQVASAALQCLGSLFAWIPLEEFVSAEILTPVYLLAVAGASTVHTALGGFLSAPQAQPQTCAFCGRAGTLEESDGSAELGGEALSCLVELLSKHFVPRQFDQFVALSMQFASSLLSKLLVPLPQQGTTLVAAIDDGFVEKLIEFLRLFIETHIARLKPLSNDSFLDFLSILYRFAFSQRSLSNLCSCLGVFSVVLEFVFGGDQQAIAAASAFAVASPAVAMTFTKYKIAFQTIASDVFRKIEFRTNQAELELLDDDSLDENNRTEWQGVLVECIDLLLKVTERMPVEMCTQISKHIAECSTTFFALESSLVVSPTASSSSSSSFPSASSDTKRLVVSDEAFSNQLHCALRDLTSLMQLLSAIVEPVFCNYDESKFAEYAPFAEELLGRALQITRFSTSNRLFALSLPSDSEVSREDFVKLHAQAILTLSEFSRWLPMYAARLCEASSAAPASILSNSQQTPELQAPSPQQAGHPGTVSPSVAAASAQKFHMFINSVIEDCCVPVISPQTHSSILVSKLSFLLFPFF